MSEKLAADRKRYNDALHAMQTGVAFKMELDAKEVGETGHSDTHPKHLRVGINSALIDTAAVARLLIEKGVFTEEEYTSAVADEAEREKENYERHLNTRLRGTPHVPVKLA